MKIGLIVAMDAARGIGKNNDLMWHLPADMKFFKETTMGHVVVMGRKNYESIPEKFRPLPNRENVVLTRNTDYDAPGCLVFHSLADCLAHYLDETERVIYIIGGGQIYEEVLAADLVDEMYITHVNKQYDAETFFPEIDEREWRSMNVFEQLQDDKHEVSFVTKKYVRKLM